MQNFLYGLGTFSLILALLYMLISFILIVIATRKKYDQAIIYLDRSRTLLKIELPLILLFLFCFLTGERF